WDHWIPDIVVEVVSPGSETRDYQDKRSEYLAAGIREYWIVDPGRGAFTALQRTGDIFEENAVQGTYTTALLPGLTLDVSSLFDAAGA
ncbi:Uma2 family endonuclease, partial [Planctomycetota bacterium]